RGGDPASRGAAFHRRLLPHHLCAPGHRADGLLTQRPDRPRPEGDRQDPASTRSPSRSPTGGPAMNAPVLSVRSISKQFGGIRAVSNVSFDVHQGEILGLIGPNGSGKSTLFNCILGQLRPTAGHVEINGAPADGVRPADLSLLGL